MHEEYLDPINSTYLIEHEKLLNDLIKLYEIKKLPKTLLFSGQKGIGKFTLALHLLNYIFDKDNYDLKRMFINRRSSFSNQIKANICENIIIISNNKKNNKIDQIRELKLILSKTTLNKKPRFIILDEIEIFNNNSLNSILKTLEEPTENTYFILINNRQKDLLETIKSRSVEFNIFINSKSRKNIIQTFIKNYEIEQIIKYHDTNISPGDYLVFNSVCNMHNIDFMHDYLPNIDKCLKLYKKNKDITFMNIALYITDIYFFSLAIKDLNNIYKTNNLKNKIIKTLNDLISYNLNLNTVLNIIYSQFNYEK
jgi:DNA polymerase-3 subunit delta'